jgi:hypothetical protein
MPTSVTDAVLGRGFWRSGRVPPPFAARSAAAPLKRKCYEPGCAVGANVTNHDVFPHAGCPVGAFRGWAEGRRGATRHRELAHAHAL